MYSVGTPELVDRECTVTAEFGLCQRVGMCDVIASWGGRVRHNEFRSHGYCTYYTHHIVAPVPAAVRPLPPPRGAGPLRLIPALGSFGRRSNLGTNAPPLGSLHGLLGATPLRAVSPSVFARKTPGDAAVHKGGAAQARGAEAVPGVHLPPLKSSCVPPSSGRGYCSSVRRNQVSTITGEQVPTAPQRPRAVFTAYLCRAYTEENCEGLHANEDRFFCEEHSFEGDHEAGGQEEVPRGRREGEVDMCCIGVMDGHDGVLAADLIAEEFPSRVLHFAKQGSSSRKQPLDEKTVPKTTVHSAFVRACEDLEQLVEKTESTAGSCLNSILLHAGRVWCANLGDCRTAYIPLFTSTELGCVLLASNVVWLSRDFRASKDYEQKRIRLQRVV